MASRKIAIRWCGIPEWSTKIAGPTAVFLKLVVPWMTTSDKISAPAMQILRSKLRNWNFKQGLEHYGKYTRRFFAMCNSIVDIVVMYSHVIYNIFMWCVCTEKRLVAYVVPFIIYDLRLLPDIPATNVCMQVSHSIQIVQQYIGIGMMV